MKIFFEAKPVLAVAIVMAIIDVVEKDKGVFSADELNEVEAAWFLSKFEEKFTPNTKLANALRRYNEAINDTENPNQTI